MKDPPLFELINLIIYLCTSQLQALIANIQSQFKSNSFQPVIIIMKQSKFELQSTLASPFGSLKRNQTKLTSSRASVFTQSLLTSKYSLPLASKINPTINPCDKKTVYKHSSKSIIKTKFIGNERMTDQIMQDDSPMRLRAQSHVDTSSIEKAIELNLMADDSLAQKSIKKTGKNHRYIHEPSSIDVEVSQEIQIPYKVKDLYRKIENENKSKPVQFSQGYLPHCKLMYFSIQNDVLFYEADQLRSKDSSKQPFHEIRLENHVLFIQEMKSSKAYKLFEHNIERMLLFVFAYQVVVFPFIESIQITLSEMSQSHFFKKSLIDCQNPSQFISDDSENMYYLDGNGILNSFEISQDKIAYWFKTGKYSLKTNKVSSIGLRTFSQNCSRIFSKNLSHFWKEFTEYGKSLFSDQMKIFSLFYDNVNKTIFTLTSFLISPPLTDPSNQKYKQLINIYQTKNGKAQFLYNITAQEIIQNFIGLTFEKTKNIKAIYYIDPCFSKDCNVLVVFQSGIRVYAHANQQKWSSIQKIDPPNLSQLHLMPNPKVDQISKQTKKKLQDIQIVNNQRVISSFSPTPTQFVRQISFLGGRLIMMITMDNRLYTYRVNHFKNKRQSEILRSIQWVKNENLKQYFIYPIDDIITAQQQCLNPGKCSCKSQLSTQIINYLNDYARQVYHSPERFLFSSDQFIKQVMVARPIDILMTLIYHFETTWQIIKEIKRFYENIQKKEIISMLTQILFDIRGEYHILSKVLHIFTNRMQITNRSQQSDLQYSQIKENQSSFILNHKQIIQEKQTFIFQILQQLAKQEAAHHNVVSYDRENHSPNQGNSLQNTQTPKKQKDSFQSMTQPQQMLMQGVILYLSRYVRTIWFKDINCFRAIFSRSLIVKFKDFKKLMISLSKAYQRLKQLEIYQTLMVFLNKINQLIMLFLSVNNLPKVSLSQALFNQSDFFQTNIFNFVIKNYQIKIVDEMKLYFPRYFSQSLYKACKLYSEIENIHSEERILSICKSFGSIPNYFYEYLENSNRLSKNQLLTLNISMKQSSKIQDLCCKIVLPSEGTYLNQYLQTYEQIKGSSRTIDEKQALIKHAEIKLFNHLKFEKNSTSVQFQQTCIQELRQIQRVLSFQKIIISEYVKISKEERNKLYKSNLLRATLTIVSEDDTKKYQYWQKQEETILQNLQHSIFQKKNLLEMARSLRPFTLQIIYLQLFQPENKNEIAEKLQKLFEMHQTAQDFHKFLKNEIEFISISTKMKISVDILLESSSKVLLKSMEISKLMNEVINVKKLRNFNSDQFWVGCYLTDIGYKESDIFAYYKSKVEDLFEPNIQIKYQSQFLYNLLSCYCFLVGFCEQKKPQFYQISRTFLAKLTNRESAQIITALQDLFTH